MVMTNATASSKTLTAGYAHPCSTKPLWPPALRRRHLQALCGITVPPSPPRVKFFMWLLVQDRVQTRSNLLKKNIISDATCELCHAVVETAEHLIFHCPIADYLWRSVGMVHPPSHIQQLPELRRPENVPARHFPVFIALCCWNIWKHRNRVIFDKAPPSLQQLRNNCSEDSRLWAWRLPTSDADFVSSWCSVLCPM